MVDKIEALDKHTVRFTLSEPFAWFLDAVAATSTWIVAREAVEKFGDLKKPEAVIGTGPWMLERYDPNVKAVFVRHPGYFVPGLPYAEAVEVSIDRDPASRFAGWLSGKYDFGPEYQQVVRRLDLETARQRKPGIQTAEYVWFTGGYSSLKLDQEPFKDVRVRRAMHRCLNWRETLETNAFSQGHGVPNAAVPAAAVDWAIPIDQLPPEGRELYEYDIAAARKLLAQAGIPAGFKVPVETTGGYGPDYLDAVQIDLKGWKDAGIDRRPKAQGVRGVHLDHDLRQVRQDDARPAGLMDRPRRLSVPSLHARPAAELIGSGRPQAHRDDQAPAAHVRRRQAPRDHPRHPAVCLAAGVLPLQPVGEGRLGLGALRQELGPQQRIRLRRADDGGLARPLTLAAPRTNPPPPATDNSQKLESWAETCLTSRGEARHALTTTYQV